MSLAPGARLGPYEIAAPLGAGGMGEVYRAHDSRLGREVAIKVLPEAFAADADRLRRFEQEARAASALNHPNLLTVFDVGTSAGQPFLVLELLAGSTLREILASGERVGVGKALDWGAQIASGLAAAHGKAIVHRDLKPENLFVCADGRIKILDFGLAKLAPGAPEGIAAARTVTADATGSGVILGTAGYMAPEQVRGEPVDGRTDLFALGCVLYELLGGRRAFHGDTAIETMNAILKEEPPSLAALRAELPPAVVRVVERCLAKRREERFQSAGDLAFALQSLAGSPSTATTAAPATATRQPAAWRRAAFALVALAALGLAGGAWLLARARPPAPPVPSFHRLTFRRGNVLHARFAPDERTVIYSATWEGQPTEIFSTQVDGTESRPLGIRSADLQAISPDGEMLILRKTSFLRSTWGVGTLARVPLAGGAPRDLAETIHNADWLPGGKVVAQRHISEYHDQLELPLGTERLDYSGSAPRVSADGRRIGLLRDTATGGRIQMLDLEGRELAGADLNTMSFDLAWHPDGELWATAVHARQAGLYALSPSGALRALLKAYEWSLHDISPTGRVLLEREIQRRSLRVGRAGDPQARDLSWLDGSQLVGFSADGRSLLFSETLEGGVRAGGVYLRALDGSPAVRLADGEGLALSEDGRWALVRSTQGKVEYRLVPTGAGTAQAVALGEEAVSGAFILPGPGQRLLVSYGARPDKGRVEIVSGDTHRDLHLPAGFLSEMAAVSPDGHRLAFAVTGKGILVCELESAGCVTVSANTPDVAPTQWSADGRYLYLGESDDLGFKVARYEIATGRKEPAFEVRPEDVTSIVRFERLALARDGRTYAVNAIEMRDSSLFVVDGLR